MKETQEFFFQRIVRKQISGKRLAEEIGELLSISKSEAYKKIKSKSALTLAQIQILCDYYQESFTIQGKENRSSANIDFTPFSSGKISVKDYIKRFELFLLRIADAKSKKLSCATDDIPIFHLFQHPELTAFKLHFWQMRVMKPSSFKFNFNDWASPILESPATLHQLYQNIPSVEIWTQTSLLNTLDQIKYAAEAKIITDKKLGKLICNQLRSVLAEIEIYAVNRNKLSKSDVSFDWYFYDIIGSITYLSETEDGLETFIRFNTFNTIHEQDGPLCTEVQHWLHHLVQDATGFSGQGNVQRNKYLSAAYDQCDEMAERF